MMIRFFELVRECWNNRKTMNFQHVVDYESAHPESCFERVDYETLWFIKFEAETGQLTMYDKSDPYTELPLNLYHHDFMDGRWAVYNIEGEVK